MKFQMEFHMKSYNKCYEKYAIRYFALHYIDVIMTTVASQITGEFPAQRASNAENGSIWWRHHDLH